MTDDLLDWLRKFIQSQVVDCSNLQIRNLGKTKRGFARENWLFDASWTDQSGRIDAELILRRDPAASLLQTSREREFAVLRLLGLVSAVPSPTARWLDASGEYFGRPALVLDRITSGLCDWFVLNNETHSLHDRLDLARQYVGLLGQVHAIDWRAHGFDRVLPVPRGHPADVELEHWRRTLRAHQLEPYPEVDMIDHWLGSHRPSTDELVVVHGDFKPGNMLIADGHITVLLDWELAHLGDPHEDLGWITNPIRKSEHQIAGRWEREEIVRHYEGVTGRRVDDSSLTYWNVFSNYKLAVITITGLHALAQGKDYSVYWGIEEFVGLALDMIKVSDAPAA